jgi:hypothetical protein
MPWFIPVYFLIIFVLKTKSENYTAVVHNTYGTQYGSTVTRHSTDAFRGTGTVLVPRVALLIRFPVWDPILAFLTNLMGDVRTRMPLFVRKWFFFSV